MKTTKKEGAKNSLKWVAISGFIFVAVLLVINFVLYSTLFLEAIKSLNWSFFLQFIFSNNILFLVLFALTSFYLMKSNRFSRVLWIVLSAYFVLPGIYSVISSINSFSVYLVLEIIIDLYLIGTSVYLIFSKKIKEKLK
jgi:hypothetical protein